MQRNKAIVGQNAFAHEAGIHQHGMLTHRETYEIMRPEEVGFTKSQLVLGKHSGRHALQARLDRAGLPAHRRAARHASSPTSSCWPTRRRRSTTPTWRRWSSTASSSRGRPCGSSRRSPPPPGTGTLPAASISLVKSGGERFQDAAAGDGPVDAVFKAIEKITGIEVKLRDYRIQSVTVGEDAQGEVSLEVEHETGVYRGRALSTDIIEGSARAFLDVVNRIALRIKPEEQEQEAKSALGTV